jgi:BirA family transcriptional regulator, biotin operon repressor / biotin---[acetyl-CoA-carboxylase] ligase
VAFVSRYEWRPVVESTNDVVAGWLADGVPEVCIAVADEQAAGRGRSGRTWTAPAGAALLLSAGFRPTWLDEAHGWRIAAVVALAMAEAGEALLDLAPGTIRLKWPNDLVAELPDAGVCKLAGVLGESVGIGGRDPRVVIGIGINAGWPRAGFPPELADSMTSLGELGDGRELDRQALADAFLVRLEPLVDELRAGGFAAAPWLARQLTDGRLVRLELPDGGTEVVNAMGVDPSTGALLVGELERPNEPRPVLVGEIRHVRLAAPGAVAAGTGV